MAYALGRQPAIVSIVRPAQTRAKAESGQRPPNPSGSGSKLPSVGGPGPLHPPNSGAHNRGWRIEQMSARTAKTITWSVAALTAGLVAGAITLTVLNRS